MSAGSVRGVPANLLLALVALAAGAGAVVIVILLAADTIG